MAAATTTRLANTSSIPRSIMWSAFDYSIIAWVNSDLFSLLFVPDHLGNISCAWDVFWRSWDRCPRAQYEVHLKYCGSPWLIWRELWQYSVFCFCLGGSNFANFLTRSVDFCLLMRSMLCRSCSHSDRAKHSKCGESSDLFGFCYTIYRLESILIFLWQFWGNLIIYAEYVSCIFILCLPVRHVWW
jgi:hypothetical protein